MNRITLLLLMILWLPSAAFAEEDDAHSRGEDVPTEAAKVLTLNQVPAGALAAARRAKPGVFFSSAEQVWWNDEPTYRIVGREFRTEWSVYVNAQGSVMRVSSNRQDDG
jgi:hypothetical protein